MRSPSFVTRLVIGVAVAVMAGFVVPPAYAVDITVPITGADGRVWLPLTHAQFLADPQVKQFDDVIARIGAGKFIGMDVVEFEGERVREDIVYRSGVTRTHESSKGSPHWVTYVKGDRQCERTTSSRAQAHLTKDSAATFRCGKAATNATRGGVFRQDMRASALEPPEIEENVTYLVLQDPPLPKGALATMSVIAIGTGALANLGVSSAPAQSQEVITVYPDRVDNDLSTSNGLEWKYEWRTLTSRKVPHLPTIVE